MCRHVCNHISIYIHILNSLLYNGYRISFPGVKRPGRGVDHPPSSTARVKERVELYIYSPSGPSWPVLGRTLPLPIYVELFYELEIFSIKQNKTLPTKPYHGAEIFFLPTRCRCRGLLLRLITLNDTHTRTHARTLRLSWARDRLVAETST
jgi:hypothetical protein